MPVFGPFRPLHRSSGLETSRDCERTKHFQTLLLRGSTFQTMPVPMKQSPGVQGEKIGVAAGPRTSPGMTTESHAFTGCHEKVAGTQLDQFLIKWGAETRWGHAA